MEDRSDVKARKCALLARSSGVKDIYFFGADDAGAACYRRHGQTPSKIVTRVATPMSF